jgi:hypothetical protein
MISLPISRREIHRYKGPSTYTTNFVRVLYEVTVGFLWRSRDKSKLVDSILRYCLPGLVRERESARGTVNAWKKLVRSRYPNPSSSHRNSSWVFVSGRFRFLKLLFLVCLLTTVPNSEPNCGRWWRKVNCVNCLEIWGDLCYWINQCCPILAFQENLGTRCKHWW